MSSLIYIACEPADATAIQCADCEDEAPASSSFYDGSAEIAGHDRDYPEHRRITWLRREVA